MATKTPPRVSARAPTPRRSAADDAAPVVAAPAAPAKAAPAGASPRDFAAARAHAAARLGRAAEDIAARFLISQGLQVLQRNFRRRLGEIDLVARDSDVLLIVEVRTRSSEQYGGAAASISARKR